MAEEQPTQAASDHSSSQNPPEHTLKKQTQVPAFFGFTSRNGEFQTFPVMYPVLVPGVLPQQQDPEQINRGPGLYAVPVLPFTGQVAGFPSNTLIPFTYNVPTAVSSSEATAAGDDQGQVGQQQQQQLPGPQRQVVIRRFQIAVQIDLLLMLKLAAVIFLFNQDGSRQRLALLVFFATLIYLYQTGALAPLVRWLSQGMQRAAARPRPARPAVPGENDPAGGRQGNEDAAEADGPGQPRGENQNQPGDDGNREVANEQVVEPGGVQGGNRWWGIVKEIQLIVFGFITSLLPGFHNID